MKTSAHYIIVNKANPIQSIEIGYLRNIYYGNTTIWQNNTKIQIIDFNIDNNLKNEFCNNFLNIAPNRLSRIWLQVSLSGKASPPLIVTSEKEMMKSVADNENAIGYVESLKKLPDEVKVIQIMY
ncbi:MAG: hypothetical protein NT007_18750 [Candidatus Kapabacteria bacterium]|nr:hypothetical protein [Candidatus Kapabacteria bacterium]